MQRQILSLVVIALFLFPLLPLPPAGAPARLIQEPNNSEIQASNPSPNNQPFSEAVSRTPSELDAPAPVEVPAPPLYQDFVGTPRATVLAWNRTITFVNRSQSSDFAVTGETGMLYHEVTNFTRIKDGKATIVVEDFNPANGFWYIDTLLVGEPVFAGFRIPSERVAIDGFWIYLFGQTLGSLNFTIYPAKPGVTAPTQPDLARPIRWPALQVVLPTSSAPTNRTWFKLETNESSLFVDHLSTYLNTYFLAMWRPVAQTKFQPCLCRDDLMPDLVDESDSYWAPNTLPWAPVVQAWDFFLNVSVIRYPYPSGVGMMVNGLPVWDSPQPATGWRDNYLALAFNMTGATRLYDVSSTAPVLSFDVLWFGQLYLSLAASVRCTVWAERSTVDWRIEFNATFPSNAMGRIILASIETDWNVVAVHCDGSPYIDWIQGSGYIRINKARTGTWLILCKAPNYVVNAEVRNLSGEVITEANASDLVTARGYLQDPYGSKATNGTGVLVVYDPRDVGIFINTSAIPTPPGGIVDINWGILDSGTYAGIYTLQIIWANGTEAGMAVTPLTVYSRTYLEVSYQYPASPEEPILRGENVIIYMKYFYNESRLKYPVDNAIIEVYDNSTGELWDSYVFYNWAGAGKPGYYTASLSTDFAAPGILHNITVLIYAEYSENQTYAKQFYIKTMISQIVFFWNGSPLPGLMNSSATYWRTSPEPYLNGSSLQFTIMYTDEGGFPLPAAQLSPYIVVNGTNQFKRLDWIDLSAMDSTSAGLYNITVDTNQIGSVTLHEGDVCYILIYAYKPGYEYAWSSPVWVRPRPRPSYIDVPLEYRNIQLYADWQYSNALRVVLRDALTGDDLSHGSLTAFIPGLGNVSLDLATPGLGLYEIRDLDTKSIQNGTHEVTIYASARDFTPATVNVSLTLIPKKQIDYSIEVWFYQAQQPNLGTQCILGIWFFFKPDQVSSMAPHGASWYQAGYERQASESLPEDTKVTLDIETSKGNFESINLYLNATGEAVYDGAFKFEGEYAFYVTITGAENYSGLSHLRLEMDGTHLSATIVSPLSYLTARLPFYTLIAALAIFIPLGSYLGYRQVVLLPRKQRRLAKYQSIADTFSDVANLNRLLVLHKESGICIFDPFAEETKDATLVAGFLQAISTFGHDLVDTPGLAGKDKEQASTLRELGYEGFRILIHDGQFVRNALVLAGTPSDQLRTRLERFTGEFEKRYRKDFDHWSGRVDQFNSASDLVEEIFLVSLRMPHRIQARRPRGVTLSPLEDDLYKLAKELTKDREYIFLGQILSTYLITAKRSKLEALMAIYQLRSKGLLVPWQLDTTLSAVSQDAANGAQ